ncbi:unknownprotein [Zostera marina]|uniref:DUF7953 domain-containing protein n=1 Tax=Zostera marina TaxID=29655 RepID=A0A0K9PJ61_ZOSMR|nr:unknownprotein [Zostera marina]
MFIPGILSSRVVNLKSVQFFTTHSWMTYGASVYFSCRQEKIITLKDVLTIDQLYTYTGNESWQPLTILPTEKCKRCGFYEKDPLTTEAFEEWELCPTNFVDGDYFHFKEDEVNATFSCPECIFPVKLEKRHTDSVVVVTGFLLASILIITGLVSCFLCYRKKKRNEEEKVRFFEMFQIEDMDDELGISTITMK